MGLSESGEKDAVEILATLNRLSLNACASKDRDALIFQILNETVRVLLYDRATLWKFQDEKFSLLGISGQSKFKEDTELASNWKVLVNDIKSPHTPQVISEQSFKESEDTWIHMHQAEGGTQVLWIPIFSKEQLSLGIWCERWSNQEWKKDEIDLLNFLAQAYGIAWEKYMPRFSWRKLLERNVVFLSLLTLAALFLIHIPLRIVAPCEVIPKDPIMITAPLEGIIEEVLVKPGQAVAEDHLLFTYDKRVALQELKVSQKQLQIAYSEFIRATTLAFEEAETLSQIAILDLKLQKERVHLDFAKYQVSKLEVKSPEAGVVMLENPDIWRGKPVRIGELVMGISDPMRTKIRIWIPEDDNVVLDPKKRLKIFLNVRPETSLAANISYISSYAKMNDHGVSSFISEAEWDKDFKGVKLGLKGSAILYGGDVTLFYWLLRRPWSSFRRYMGV